MSLTLSRALVGTLIALASLESASAKEIDPRDDTGAPCGRTSEGKVDGDFVVYQVTNACKRPIYIDGKIGNYPIGRTIDPGKTEAVDCYLPNRDLCGNKELRGFFVDYNAPTRTLGSSDPRQGAPVSTGNTSRHAAVDIPKIPNQPARALAKQAWFDSSDYPPEARKAGRSGATAVSLDVSAEGRVTSCRVT
jgi:hypothetical protein